MNIQIIANSISGITQSLWSMGYKDIKSVKWNRLPFYINGIWHAEVQHGRAN